jgi:ribose 5-phosphate isomerase A
LDKEQQKRAAAEAAIAHVQQAGIIGVGTGSTTDYFIDALATIKHKIDAAVASSEQTARRLKQHGIEVVDLNSVANLAVYVDGADQIDHHGRMIKGGGGALTREKIIAQVAKQFICIVDASKQVDVLGKTFPLPVEVIPMARSYIARELVKLGGEPEYRAGFVTDNGNVILDVHGVAFIDPLQWEQQLNALPGVVCHGLFAARGANRVIVATTAGIVETVWN